MINLINNIWAIEIDSDAIGNAEIEGGSLIYTVSRISASSESQRLPAGKWEVMKMLKGYCIIKKTS